MSENAGYMASPFKETAAARQRGQRADSGTPKNSERDKPMDFLWNEQQEQIRDAIERVCAPFDADYWLMKDREGGFPHDFHKALADAEPGVIFGGRLGEYKYYDMDKVIEVALDVAAKELA